ncbi:type II toxin-antitoxin system Rv0910 family toxin [Rhodococcoides kyotonense]|uniref:Polyketide cyclase / dehydrase and lipid transport n=1 Tax=Rhodococcoides kyotonense TaxID=398843 RepID=A0A239EGB3_9NOCA|nr:SRPBCC family protein [Rhodococcus kyotonensis]SNS43298.1 Polyketide cyclase / dehydrase and lipid transport [Rhodococcus kyotonensis]
MAKLKVSVNVPLDPESTWAHASDLSEYDKWLSIHEAWRGELPEQLSAGTTLDSVASVKGMRNRVRWTIESYDPPKKLKLKGSGKGGVKIGLVLSVAPGKSGGSDLSLDIDLGGAPLFGPIGSGVARALKGDIEKSLKTFESLYS